MKDARDDAAKKHGALRIGCGRGTLLTDSDEWWQALGEDELASWYGK